MPRTQVNQAEALRSLVAQLDPTQVELLRQGLAGSDSEHEIVYSLMSKKPVVQPKDTPWCCNPASETYWSM